MHSSETYMRALGVDSVDAWAQIARRRTPTATLEQISQRVTANGQMQAMLEATGAVIDDSVQEDQELLIYGYMPPEEFKAYLEAKYGQARS